MRDRTVEWIDLTDLWECRAAGQKPIPLGSDDQTVTDLRKLYDDMRDPTAKHRDSVQWKRMDATARGPAIGIPWERGTEFLRELAFTEADLTAALERVQEGTPEEIQDKRAELVYRYELTHRVLYRLREQEQREGDPVVAQSLASLSEYAIDSHMTDSSESEIQRTLSSGQKVTRKRRLDAVAERAAFVAERLKKSKRPTQEKKGWRKYSPFSASPQPPDPVAEKQFAHEVATAAIRTRGLYQKAARRLGVESTTNHSLETILLAALTDTDTTRLDQLLASPAYRDTQIGTFLHSHLWAIVTAERGNIEKGEIRLEAQAHRKARWTSKISLFGLSTKKQPTASDFAAVAVQRVARLPESMKPQEAHVRVARRSVSDRYEQLVERSASNNPPIIVQPSLLCPIPENDEPPLKPTHAG